MIFATVGTQLPFDRLTSALDEWARAHAEKDVFAQIGATGFIPQSMRWSPSLTPEQFQRQLSSASLVISHAGIGSIISALELGKPLIVMPRQARYGEHRNDHQVATAKRFQAMRSIRVVQDEHELVRCLSTICSEHTKVAEVGPPAPKLLSRIRDFISANDATRSAANAK